MIDTTETTAPVPAPEAFFVISPTLKSYDRTRCLSQAIAEIHAMRIMDREGCDKLFVVKVVSVVEKPVPKADIRPLRASDF